MSDPIPCPVNSEIKPTLDVYDRDCPICEKPLPTHPGRYAVTNWPDNQPKHMFCATFLPEADDFLVRGGGA